MKTLVTFVVLLGALLITGRSSPTGAAGNLHKQRAVTQFTQLVQVHGVTLKAGEYLFVHDDAAMKRGESCTYIYKGRAEIARNLIVSFHCTPVEREKVRRFTLRSVEPTPGTIELREFQFKGDTESHLIPAMVR